MARAPQFKVYDRNGTYQAACKEVEAAAALCAFYGTGSCIRWDHGTALWTEGADGEAAESYDAVAMLAYRRMGS